MNLRQESAVHQLTDILKNRIDTAYPVGKNVSDFLGGLEAHVNESIAYLESDQAQQSMRLDPYWPKWNSPWWHMTLLDELGLTERIPYKGLELLEEGLSRYIHFFPATLDEVPIDRDPIADVLCFCALATAHRILLKRNCDVDANLPWLRAWYTSYQLPDGGYNCDETAYANENGKSSMISTIHMMETLMLFTSLEERELRALDRAAEYMIKRKLMRSLKRNNQIMDPKWTLFTFPRFYEIDILRALNCITKWALLRERHLPWQAIEEVVLLIDEKLHEKPFLEVERQFYSTCKTMVRAQDGTWLKKQPVSVFPLLLAAGVEGQPAPLLTKAWQDAVSDLARLNEKDLIDFN